MPPPIACGQVLPANLLPVTVAVPPSLAIAPPALSLVLLLILLPDTVRVSEAAAGRESGAAAGRERGAAAAERSVAGWPFWPLSMPPPSPLAVLLLIVLDFTVTLPARFLRPPFWIPPPP